MGREGPLNIVYWLYLGIVNVIKMGKEAVGMFRTKTEEMKQQIALLVDLR